MINVSGVRPLGRCYLILMKHVTKESLGDPEKLDLVVINLRELTRVLALLIFKIRKIG